MGVDKVLSWYNFFTGSAVVLLTGLMGERWYVLLTYLVFQTFDFISGSYKARKKKESSSRVAADGIKKKLFYWILIMTSFMVASTLRLLIRDELGYDVEYMMDLGWLTTAMLMINEVRSILENLVEIGVDVPDVLVKGLKVTSNMINSKASSTIPDEESKD